MKQLTIIQLKIEHSIRDFPQNNLDKYNLAISALFKSYTTTLLINLPLKAILPTSDKPLSFIWQQKTTHEMPTRDHKFTLSTPNFSHDYPLFNIHMHYSKILNTITDRLLMNWQFYLTYDFDNEVYCQSLVHFEKHPSGFITTIATLSKCSIFFH